MTADHFLDRYAASFITAQVFLRLLRPAARHGRTTLAQLGERYVDEGQAG